MSDIIIHSDNTPAAGTLGIPDLIRMFLAEQDVRGSSRETYARNIRWYFEWVENTSRQLRDLTLADMLEYKQFLLDKKLGSSTVGSYLTVVKLFYEWAAAKKLYPNITEGLKLPRMKKEFQKMPLKPEQARQFLEHFSKRVFSAAGDPKHAFSAERDFALVNLLIRTGLREMEPIGANIEDIGTRGGKRCLFIRSKGKSDKTDYVILSDKAWGPLANYLSLHPEGALGGAPLFVNQHGKRLNTSHVRKIVKAALRAIGLTGREYSTHSLRHTAASLMVAATGSSEGAQAVLRHKNAATTALYTGVAREQARLDSPPEELLDDII